MIETLPDDVLIHILKFLWNDIVSIGRLASCNPVLHSSIMRAGDSKQEQLGAGNACDCQEEYVVEESLWKPMYHWTWRHHNSDSGSQHLRPQHNGHSYYRRQYQRRHRIDHRAMQLLRGMTKDLADALLSHRTNGDNRSDDVNEAASNDSSNLLDRLDQSCHLVGSGWDHADWNALMFLRMDIMDRMRRHAQKHLLSIRQHEEELGQQDESHPISFESRLEGFLAARTFQRLYLLQSLLRWKELVLPTTTIGDHTSFSSNTSMSNNDSRDYGGESVGVGSRVNNGFHEDMVLLEEFSLLACQIQQSPADLLLPSKATLSSQTETGEQLTVDKRIQNQLDALALECKQEILEKLPRASKSSSIPISLVEQQVQCINAVLFERHGFQGNQDDYYNYRNSLLDHVLASKQGNPITLAILYTCVCRRLWEELEQFVEEDETESSTNSPAVNFQAYLVGLPGHVVVGIRPQMLHEVADESGYSSNLFFLDTFRCGKVLTLEACQDICHSYGVAWDIAYAQPMKSSMVFRRTLANLTNCHFREQQHRVMVQQNEERPREFRHDLPELKSFCPFHQELWFQQRALLLLHSQPVAIIPLLLERLSQELPLTLSPDLLDFFGLLSPSASSSVALPWSPTG